MASNIRLSKHFHISEFHCHDGTPVPTEAVDDIRRLVQWWLEPLRLHFNARVTVISGYRTPTFNQKVGGALHSVHMLKTALPLRVNRTDLAAAADVMVKDVTVQQLHAWAIMHRSQHDHLAKRSRGGVGFYPIAHFCHLDTAGWRSWTG